MNVAKIHNHNWKRASGKEEVKWQENSFISSSLFILQNFLPLKRLKNKEVPDFPRSQTHTTDILHNGIICVCNKKREKENHFEMMSLSRWQGKKKPESLNTVDNIDYYTEYTMALQSATKCMKNAFQFPYLRSFRFQFSCRWCTYHHLSAVESDFYRSTTRRLKIETISIELHAIKPCGNFEQNWLK